MVTTNGAAPCSFEATVERVNERGFTVVGQAGWLNLSKWATVTTLPAPGDRVAITLDKGGFVRAIEVLGSTAEVSSEIPRIESRNGEPGRETRITRMAAINSAIALLNNHGPASVAQVLATAEAFEQWVTR